MSSTRSIISPPPFAENALTVIPPTPVAGVSYRDETAGPASSPDGWPYAERVNSAEFNQILFQLTTLLGIMDKQGVLGWSSAVDYVVPAFTIGSNGLFYFALLASGPAGSGAKDPISEPTYWRLVVSPASTTLAGVSELATNAEMATGTSTTLVPPVAAVMSLFSKRAFNTTDYIRIPDVASGLLLQWGSVVTGASGVTATFATPFGTVLNVVTNALQTVDVNTTHQAPTNTSVFVQAYNQAGALVSGTNIRYFAVGVAP